jgi:hypothetical protein
MPDRIKHLAPLFIRVLVSRTLRFVSGHADDSYQGAHLCVP